MARSTTELWQVGIVHATVESLLSQGDLQDARISWFPDPGPFRFIADPFGLWHDGHLTVLAEALDYRVKRGEIHYYSFGADGQVLAQGLALREPFHLSYPGLIRYAGKKGAGKNGDGQIYMLPEGHRSGKLTVYRAERFPDRWVPAAVLLDMPAIDASVIEHDGRWWMFYALPGDDNRAMRELHVAWADDLFGPWTQHTANPVRSGLDSARPGGTPFVRDGKLHLPTQNCVGGYGRSLNVLRIDALSPDAFTASIATELRPEGLRDGWTDGLHTLSAAGDVTLIDIKRLDPSPGRGWIDIQRRLNRLFK